MKNIKEFIKQTAVLILFTIASILIILFVFSKFNIQTQPVETSYSAYQLRIENLESEIISLENQKKGYKSIQDSLIQRNKELDKEITIIKHKRAQDALKYAELKNKVNELDNDSSAGLFLDRADCSEFPVLKYEENYITPIDAIRFYNQLSVDFDQQTDENKSLLIENDLCSSKVNILNEQIIVKDLEIANRDSVIINKDKIIIENDNRIKLYSSMLKSQKKKTVFYSISGFVIGLVTGKIM